jgi:GAF domain-containing protein
METDPELLSRTFVQLADSLIDEFDIIELLTLLTHRCAELFDAGAAGILLGDQRGSLQVVAASTEQARLLELFQLQSDEGPCLECFSTGRAIAVGDLETITRWPRFGREAQHAGFRAVNAFPLRLRDVIIGTLNLFMFDPVLFSADELSLCQALADVATIAILQNQAAARAETVGSQLQRALDSRIAIEQAKGILAERFGVEMGVAFAHMRRHARNTNQRLSDLAADVVAGIAFIDLDGGRGRPPL